MVSGNAGRVKKKKSRRTRDCGTLTEACRRYGGEDWRLEPGWEVQKVREREKVLCRVEANILII